MEYEPDSRRLQRRWGSCGAVAEWSKALAWKVSIRQKRIEGSNPSRSATIFIKYLISGNLLGLSSRAHIFPGIYVGNGVKPLERKDWPEIRTGYAKGPSIC